MDKSEFFLQRVHGPVWKKLAATEERQNSRKEKGCLGWYDTRMNQAHRWEAYGGQVGRPP